MKSTRLLLTLMILSVNANSGGPEIARLVGTYTYESYRLTLPNGQTGGFNMHGAIGAETEIRPDRSIIFRLFMADGREISARATLVDAQLIGNTGFIIQKWPDMNYEVRTEIEITTTGMTYTNRFKNKHDHARYGMVEHAVLKRAVRAKMENNQSKK